MRASREVPESAEPVRMNVGSLYATEVFGECLSGVAAAAGRLQTGLLPEPVRLPDAVLDQRPHCPGRGGEVVEARPGRIRCDITA